MVIPTLGQLRKLPRVETESDRPETTAVNPGSNIGFTAMMLLSVIALLIAGYCGICWAAISVDQTQESHIAEIVEHYGEAEPGAMILEFEHMEAQALELTAPFDYQIVIEKKANWGRNAAISGAAAVIFAIVGLTLVKGRRST
ncbi:hypothetical protein [Rhodopirellula sp. MGV]|uniref:hypothetical protein n=1 Tax=Rhodopirellula sp. MGV TaxID=2023130 RepID=UPI000B97A5F7|nr:hypothetical protein [Rhodopirellula sp. MGV]PNY37101.1 hypothetical protein C2E31_09690 [Rhodopirellula baltica]